LPWIAPITSTLGPSPARPRRRAVIGLPSTEWPVRDGATSDAGWLTGAARTVT
jgi:hypothetical protein